VITGKLYLIPTIIADDTAQRVIPAGVTDALKQISYFLAEDIRSARRYLSSLKIYPSIESLHFDVLNKETASADVAGLLKPLYNGHNMGVLSESGCPGIADPGALAVAEAHRTGIKVVPLVGPSSISLALMASGLNGQRFAFHGYLPVDKAEVTHALKQLIKESKTNQQTQLFIETPYRNNALFSLLLQVLPPEAQLCVALDVTGKSEYIQTKPIRKWRKEKKEWPKLPALFLFLA
jgi:16S rRNA (cytidine1402-2'-O)-methyltransferase